MIKQENRVVKADAYRNFFNVDSVTTDELRRMFIKHLSMHMKNIIFNDIMAEVKYIDSLCEDEEVKFKPITPSKLGPAYPKSCGMDKFREEAMAAESNSVAIVKTKVKVEFFKEGGKYYTSIEFETELPCYDVYGINDELKSRPDFISGMLYTIDIRQGFAWTKRIM